MKAVARVGRNLWIAFLVLVVGLVSPTSARDLPGERESLAGLAGVHLVVEDMKPDVERYGLTRSALRRDVELRLRQTGIRVLSVIEWAEVPPTPSLTLRVTALRNEAGSYAVSVALDLVQDVRLVRDPTITAPTATWQATGTLATHGARMLPEVREGVCDLVDQFLNDYMAANPKR